MFKLPKLIACLGLITLAAGFAEESSLVQHSPFLPPLYKQSAEKPEKKDAQIKPDPTRFILKGVSKIGPNYLFSIYDSVTQKGQWIEAGVAYNGFVITKYEPAARRIYFRWNGNDYTSELPIADDTPVSLNFLTDNAPAISKGSGLSSQRLTTDNRTIRSSSSSPLAHGTPIESNPTTHSVHKPFIVFNEGGLPPKNVSSFFNSSSGNLFASLDPTTDTTPQLEGTVVPTTRYQVSRPNKVHSPSGKKPDHMTFAQWNALNQQ